jgi:hypothetical protein
MPDIAPNRSQPRADRTLDLVRPVVRDLLLRSSAFQSLAPNQQRELAGSMVRVCHTAAALIREEIDTTAELGTIVDSPHLEPPLTSPRFTQPADARAAAPLVRAQNAGQSYSGTTADRIAGVTRSVLNAVSFPRFITELINGVFRAIVDSSQTQMQAYVDLLRNVSATVDGFADSTSSNGRARAWLAEKYPASYELIRDEDEVPDPGQPPPESELRLRPGASPPSEAALRTDLGIPEDQSVPTGNPERTLVPLAKLALARQRQQMLATLVMLGLQRIVVDSGRINASMRFHIDTRSAAQDDSSSEFGLRNEINASANYGMGVWGASADIHNTITYVSTQKSQTTEEMNTDLELNSAVEIYFKSDYLPLERLAGSGQLDRIRANTLNPESEAKAAAEARSAREKRYSESDARRAERADQRMAPPKPESKPTPIPDRRPEPKPEPKPNAPQPVLNPPANGSTGSPGSAGSTGSPGSMGSPGASGSPRSGGVTGGSPTPPVRTSAYDPGTTFAAESPGSDSWSSTVTSSVPTRSPDVVFVPSQDEVIDEMLRLAAPQPGECLFDLGCGDGRILVAAARNYGCRCVGIDIDPQRIAEARENIAHHGLEDRVELRRQDLFSVDLQAADIVTLYLLPSLNVKLIPQLRHLRPGTRIVSHDFDMKGVVPDRVVQIYLARPGLCKTFFLWRAPFTEPGRQIPTEWRESARLVA